MLVGHFKIFYPNKISIYDLVMINDQSAGKCVRVCVCMCESVLWRVCSCVVASEVVD